MRHFETTTLLQKKGEGATAPNKIISYLNYQEREKRKALNMKKIYQAMGRYNKEIFSSFKL